MKKVLVTGAAGFIGYHLTQRLLADGYGVAGVDNLNDYYDVALKQARLVQIQENPLYKFYKADIADRDAIARIFKEFKFNYVVNLAAQVGVRYSVKNPYAYIDSNVVGFLNILEGCRHARIEHLVYASSSSIYGANTRMPFSVNQNVDHPISLYAATKKSNELMAHAYSSLYQLPCTGLRFFTVYGPWYRPDMALSIFARAIMEGRPIDVFNNGKMQRDFTYVDDIVEGIVRVMRQIPSGNPAWTGDVPDPGTSYAPYRLYNIGNNSPVELMHVIEILEQELGRRTTKNFLPMQAGDVPATFADVDDLVKDVGFKPSTPIQEGIRRFVAWYRSYYGI
ncbi:MAG: NAD-dependent epimerase [Gammaproteobacteria bacterium]